MTGERELSLTSFSRHRAGTALFLSGPVRARVSDRYPAGRRQPKAGAGRSRLERGLPRKRQGR